ncbi:hypothetical protein IQ251_01025 [Saccharopolyspora sp. HNM0983]|uniref:J domain-containing protein n=1 Tax=Saccharopolyspora montiporae TaxID=2781240 RepID=A0A929B4H6_9PSEU|nr:hypothetical protein [Saccharopolyspora sp. HNM0983]MBE9373019.1 hypothetical protein [Saccharopolyspora sp. HNM0983]
MTARDPATRAAIRAFARTHHPDVGGDPDVFAAGLAELRGERADRADAPITAVEDRSRLRRALARVLRRNRPRHAANPRGGVLR